MPWFFGVFVIVQVGREEGGVDEGQQAALQPGWFLEAQQAEVYRIDEQRVVLDRRQCLGRDDAPGDQAPFVERPQAHGVIGRAFVEDLAHGDVDGRTRGHHHERGWGRLVVLWLVGRPIVHGTTPWEVTVSCHGRTLVDASQ